MDTHDNNNETSNVIDNVSENNTHKNKSISVLKKQKEALKIAHDVRKFELELYWKRAIYFWAFIISIFTVFFALLASDYIEPYKQTALMCVAIVGLVFSMSWYCVNRGSKHWQQNWEMVIQQLEQNITGSVFTTYIKNKTPFHHLLSSYPFSVSKINQLVSLFIFLVWVVIFTFILFKKEFMAFLEKNPSEYILWTFLVSFLILLLILSIILIVFRRQKKCDTSFGISTSAFLFSATLFIFAIFDNIDIFYTKIFLFISLFLLIGLVFIGFCKSKNACLKE